MTMQLTQGIHSVKHIIDLGAVAASAASILHWMPDVAGALSSIWMIIRISEWIYKKIKK